MTRKECLENASAIVCGIRDNTYGKPEDNFALIANLWTVYLAGNMCISSKDVAMMMALLKIARIKSGKHKDDNFVDMAGYAACGCEICEGDEHEYEGIQD